MEDVTTPLRFEEYSDGYKLNMENNSLSAENREESSIMEENVSHTPYSLGSQIVFNGTPELHQARTGLHLTQIIRQNNQISDNMAPRSCLDRTITEMRRLHPLRVSQEESNPNITPYSIDDVDAYVRPDFEKDMIKRRTVTDERGYEIYDPSPCYSEHCNYSVGGVEEVDDFGEGQSRVDENLLASANKNFAVVVTSIDKRNEGSQKLSVKMPLSSSMPDDVIDGQTNVITSLNPTTTSASSNASNISTIPSRMTNAGRYLSLKAMADSLGSSMLPARLRMKNIRLFNHKRTGSNTSHKSTSSNPNTSTSTTASVGRADDGVISQTDGSPIKSMSGKNFMTIESDSNDANIMPRFLTATSSISENPNYRRLNEAVSWSEPTSSNKGKTRTQLPCTSSFAISSNPNYRSVDNKSSAVTGETNYIKMTDVQISELDNTNYQIMGTPPSLTATTNLDNNVYNMPLISRQTAPLAGGSSPEEGTDEERSDCARQSNLNSNRSVMLPNKFASYSTSSYKGFCDSYGNVITPFAAQPETVLSESSTLKEKWLLNQQITGSGDGRYSSVTLPTVVPTTITHAQPPPPPNGFVGREA